MKHARELAAIVAAKQLENWATSRAGAKVWVEDVLSVELEKVAAQGKQSLTTAYPADIDLPTAIHILGTYGFKVTEASVTITISW